MLVGGYLCLGRCCCLFVWLGLLGFAWVCLVTAIVAYVAFVYFCGLVAGYA